MAISPPSDILLDVANAADPAQVRVAQARLAKLASDPAAVDADFAKMLAAARTDGKTISSTTPPSALAATPTVFRKADKGPDAAYRKFEALLLQNFVESMLPKSDELYGDKQSAGVYRSMMAEQFAAQISKAGGIGIAKAIATRHPAVAAVPLPAAKPTVT